MQIKRLAATFGRLENETLDLEPGLNVIEAPNEAGKSTWTAFLREIGRASCRERVLRLV